MDLENLFTSRQGFGVESATFLQRVICRITDGAPLADLLDRVTETERIAAARIVGCDPYSVPHGAPPGEVVDLEPVRCGKSLRYAALAVARSQTIDVSIVKPGEEGPRISLLSTATDTANTLRGHLNVIHERPALKGLFIGETADSVTLRHPTGLPIEIKVIAAHRGGYSLASRWAGSVIFDEAPGWNSTDRVVSLEESREQALGRLLPGGQNIFGGSPWQPHGLCWDLFRSHFGKPSEDLVVIQAAPAWELNPTYWTTKRVERIRRTSPRTYQMHLLAQFGSAQNAAFDFEDVNAAFREGEPPQWYRRGPTFLSLDPSSLAGDAFGWAFLRWMYPPTEPIARMLDTVDAHGNVVHHRAMVARDAAGEVLYEHFDPRPLLHVFSHGAFEGEELGRLTMDTIVGRLAGYAHRTGTHSIVSDQRESAALESMFRAQRCMFQAYPWTNESKDAAVTTLRRLLRERRLWIRPCERMQSEMHSYGYKLLPNGRFRYEGRLGSDDRVATLITFAHAINARNDIQHTRHEVPGR